MRMRRKKNLDEKLASVGEYLIQTEKQAMDVRESVKKKEYVNTEHIFGFSGALMLEIGCGKGRFASESASREPDACFIAVEKSANVIYEACLSAKMKGVSNLRFLNADARLLPKYLPPHSVGRIYLNFSCPYPKKGYENRRLTNPTFLAIYDELLLPGGSIELKTDNRAFFEYSLDTFEEAGFILTYVTRDLYNEDHSQNIQTEYEEKFVSQGIPICRLSAHKAAEV